MNIKKVLFTLLIIHALAFLLTACGGDSNQGIKVPPSNVCAPGDFPGPNGVCIGTVYGSPVYASPQFYPFIRNANITASTNFEKMMVSEFGRPASCHGWNGVNCDSLQIIIKPVSENRYSVVLRSLSANQGYNIYGNFGDVTYANQGAGADSVSFFAVPQTQTRNGVTSIRFQSSQINAFGPAYNSAYEHTLNHLFLQTDGPLSNKELIVQLYYNKGGTRGGAIAYPQLIAQGKLIKGRDYP